LPFAVSERRRGDKWTQKTQPVSDASVVTIASAVDEAWPWAILTVGRQEGDRYKAQNGN